MNAELNAQLMVGVAAPIKNDPELYNAVRQATEYFEKSIKDHNLDPAKRELLWGCSDEPTPKHVIPSLHESDRYGSRHASNMTTRERILDPVSRDLAVIALLQDVLRQRWYQIRTVVNKGIEELEREEQRHAQPI